MKVKTRKVVFILITSLIILLVLSFLGRGWIRRSVVPAYADHFYRSGVEKDFDSDFLSLNTRFRAYGFTFNNTDTLQDQCSRDTHYEGIKLSVYCIKLHDSDTHPVTQSFIDQWKAMSPGLEKELFAGGWHKEWNVRQPIAEIYDDPSNSRGTVYYSKVHDKTLCEVGFGATAFPYGSTTFTRDGEKTYVDEQCTRSIVFFGGY